MFGATATETGPALAIYSTLGAAPLTYLSLSGESATPLAFSRDGRYLAVDVQSTAVDQATHACTSAITNPAPYGAWTPDMIETLGTEQDLMIDFFYE